MTTSAGRDESTCRADSLSVAEPPGGSAPTVSELLIVEQPGPWGAAAVEDCRMNPAVKAKLQQLAGNSDLKVFLARRRDRKQLLGRRNVWFMQRTGRNVAAGHLQLPETSPVLIPWDSLREASFPETPPPGSSHSAVLGGKTDRGDDVALADEGHPIPDAARIGAAEAGSGTLRTTPFICTNGARDRCCAIEGRDLLMRLSTDVWEISHLGGHRFAPTALRFPDGLLFGRLDIPSARVVASGRTPGTSYVRGRFGRTAWQQVAELAVAEETAAELHELDSAGEPGSTFVSDGHGTTWRVSLTRHGLAPRRASCDKDPVDDQVWIPTAVSPA